MTLLITDPLTEELIIAERREKGLDRHDEVWEGVYVVSPDPTPEHQLIVGLLTTIFVQVIKFPGDGVVFPGLNVSDRGEEWTQNYRCPDVAVYLKNNPVVKYEAHYCGGPDLAVEITSPYDKAREKLDFYAQVNTRELLILDRDVWSLELYQLEDGKLVLKGTSTVEQSQVLPLLSVPVTMQMQVGEPRPQILVTHPTDGRTWTI